MWKTSLLKSEKVQTVVRNILSSRQCWDREGANLGVPTTSTSNCCELIGETIRSVRRVRELWYEPFERQEQIYRHLALSDELRCELECHLANRGGTSIKEEICKEFHWLKKRKKVQRQIIRWRYREVQRDLYFAARPINWINSSGNLGPLYHFLFRVN